MSLGRDAKYDVLFERVSKLRELVARREVDPDLVDSIEKVLRQVRSCDPKWGVYLDIRRNQEKSTARDFGLASNSAARSASSPASTGSPTRAVERRRTQSSPDRRGVQSSPDHTQSSPELCVRASPVDATHSLLDVASDDARRVPSSPKSTQSSPDAPRVQSPPRRAHCSPDAQNTERSLVRRVSWDEEEYVREFAAQTEAPPPSLPEPAGDDSGCSYAVHRGRAPIVSQRRVLSAMPSAGPQSPEPKCDSGGGHDNNGGRAEKELRKAQRATTFKPRRHAAPGRSVVASQEPSPRGTTLPRASSPTAELSRQKSALTLTSTELLREKTEGPSVDGTRGDGSTPGGVDPSGFERGVGHAGIPQTVGEWHVMLARENSLSSSSSASALSSGSSGTTVERGQGAEERSSEISPETWPTSPSRGEEAT
ncbi:hypothetical protein T484DRAFT_1837546 [Baffinella frigidus]|nr:hypothetical protein T484DRAFT_1837546 [Cryptophyta sp. CCMP2293]